MIKYPSMNVKTAMKAMVSGVGWSIELMRVCRIRGVAGGGGGGGGARLSEHFWQLEPLNSGFVVSNVQTIGSEGLRTAVGGQTNSKLEDIIFFRGGCGAAAGEILEDFITADLCRAP